MADQLGKNRAAHPAAPGEGPRGRPVSRRAGVRGRPAVHGLSGAAGRRRGALVAPSSAQPPARCSQLAFARELTPEDLTHVAWQLFWNHLLAAGCWAGWRWLPATLGFRLVTTRFGFSLKKLAPDLARLNPLSTSAGTAAPEPAGAAAAGRWSCCRCSCGRSMPWRATSWTASWRCPCKAWRAGCAFMGASLMELFWKAAGVFLVFGAVDLVRQLRRYQPGPAHEQAGHPARRSRTSRAIRR